VSTKTLKDIVASVQIGEVRLVGVEAKSGLSPSRAVSGQASANIEHRANMVGSVAETGEFTVMADLRFQVVPEGSTDPLFTLSAQFVVSYTLPPGFQCPPDALQAFAGSNGVFNVWPFFREIVHSTMARMMIRPVSLPLFRFGTPGGVAQDATSNEPGNTQGP
jgi:hypothetical protein